MSFSDSVSTSPGQRQNYRTLAQALNHQIFQWTVILLNQSTALYTSAVYPSSDGQCRPDLTRRIGLACAVMTSLKPTLSDKRLTLDTKLRIGYQTLVLSVLLYAADTWALL